MPLKAIAREVGVSLSSVSLWTRDIAISDLQRERNAALAASARSAAWAHRNRARRLEHQRAGREQARRGDANHQAGCMLYWAEGSKSRNTVGFTNSDWHQHTVNSLPTSSSGRRLNKLPYGVCTLKVHSTRIVQEIYGAIQEYAGIERPEWLD